MTNKGLVSAFNVRMAPSNSDPEMILTLPLTTIPELKAGQSVTVPVKVTLLHSSCRNNGVQTDAQYTCAAGNTEECRVCLTAEFTQGDR